MASQTEAITTAREESSNFTDGVISGTEAPPSKPKRSKYRHVAAYHSKLQHSSLSRDAEVTPSFLGFRNLMVLVLGRIALEIPSICNRLISNSGDEPATDY
jgi:diacylglycerol O-acyltransferase-1